MEHEFLVLNKMRIPGWSRCAPSSMLKVSYETPDFVHENFVDLVVPVDPATGGGGGVGARRAGPGLRPGVARGAGARL